jgi:zinc/manganese transport system substrate-binding protein
MKKLILSILLTAVTGHVHADLNIFACEPEWAALADEIGGDRVDSSSATTALQDPHYIQARPSLISRVRRADIVICSGAQLEIGWLPLLLTKANNPKVQAGSTGHLFASDYVDKLQIPTNFDRSQGDVHPEGNPHVHTNPHNITIIASILAQRMMQLDKQNSNIYQQRLDHFIQRWNDAIVIWEDRIKPLKGKKVISHHNSWPYLLRWLGMEEVANLESTPGIPPSVSYLSNLASQFSSGGADYIIRTPFQNVKPSQWLSERSGIPMILLPLTIGGTEKANNLFAMFDDIIDRFLETTK